MSSEFLEKTRNIIVTLFVLFFSFLIMLTAFCSLPVHAEEVNQYIYDFTWSEDNSGSWVSRFSGEYQIHSNIEIAFVKNGFSRTFVSGYSGEEVTKHGYYLVYLTADKQDVKGTKSLYYSGSFSRYEGSKLYDTKTYNYGDSNAYTTAYSLYYSNFNETSSGFYNEIETTAKIFNSVDSAIKYVETGDTSGIINGGSDLDPHDDAYAFTGFSMSGKTATWTGTTERSYLLDMDVEEWVNYTYGFASSEDQEVSSFIDAEAHYQTSDKKLALPWDEMEANKKESEFIRQVNIIPCYGTSGAGFYFGLPCKVFYHKDGSVDKVELPASNGILSSDMERPVIVLNEASNGNPVGGDYSYFRFNNAQDDYFIEMKGRWYSTNDFDIYRENLVWKYKYQTILKNDLSTWVSVSDSVNSVGSFRFDVLGKTSWENLLSLYPVDNRNYEGGSFALFNKITGYTDALDTLKMLLKQPFSLYNGYEIYVRYYRYDDNGNLQYSKWTHFYNNLADAAGSSGSRLDDLNNMYSENQSDKGLTDDELSDLENTGNSRNDLDAVPKNNYDYSSLENATMNFFDLLTNFGTMLGQFPSMVAVVFGFLPSWLIGLIAVAIGAVIVCRFIGR